MKVRKAVAISGLLAVLVTSGAGSCDKAGPCVIPGERVHGGGPQAGSEECKARQEKARKLHASESAAASRKAAHPTRTHK